MFKSQLPDLTQALANLAEAEAAAHMLRATCVGFDLTAKFDSQAPQVVMTKPQEVIHSLLNGEQTLIQERWISRDPESCYEHYLLLASGAVRQSVAATFDGHTERWHMSHVAPDPATQPARIGFISEKSYGRWVPQFTSPWGGNFGDDSSFATILSNGNPRLVETSPVNGFETLRIEATQPNGEQTVRHTAWLAPERSCREARKAITITIPGPDNLQRQIRYETSNFVQFREQWIPQAGREISWLENSHGPYYWSQLKWWKIVELEPLVTDQNSHCAFDFPLGTAVNDQASQNSYCEGGDIKPDLELLRMILKRQRLPKDIEAFVYQSVREACI